MKTHRMSSYSNGTPYGTPGCLPSQQMPTSTVQWYGQHPGIQPDFTSDPRCPTAGCPSVGYQGCHQDSRMLPHPEMVREHGLMGQPSFATYPHSWYPNTPQDAPPVAMSESNTTRIIRNDIDRYKMSLLHKRQQPRIVGFRELMPVSQENKEEIEKLRSMPNIVSMIRSSGHASMTAPSMVTSTAPSVLQYQHPHYQTQTLPNASMYSVNAGPAPPIPSQATMNSFARPLPPQGTNPPPPQSTHHLPPTHVPIPNRHMNGQNHMQTQINPSKPHGLPPAHVQVLPHHLSNPGVPHGTVQGVPQTGPHGNVHNMGHRNNPPGLGPTMHPHMSQVCPTMAQIHSPFHPMLNSPYPEPKAPPFHGQPPAPNPYPTLNSPAPPTSMQRSVLSPGPQLKRSHSSDPNSALNGPSAKRSCSATPPGVVSPEYFETLAIEPGVQYATEQLLFEKEMLNLKNIVNIKKFNLQEPVMRRVLRRDAFLFFDSIFSDGEIEEHFWPTGVSVYCNSRRIRTFGNHPFIIPETIVHAGENTIRFDLQKCSCMASANGHHKTGCQYRDLARNYFRLRVCVVQKSTPTAPPGHFMHQPQPPPPRHAATIQHISQNCVPLQHQNQLNSVKPRSRTPITTVTSPTPPSFLSHFNGVITPNHQIVSPTGPPKASGNSEGKPSPANSSNRASPNLSRPRGSSTGSPDELLDADDTNVNVEHIVIESPSVLPELSSDDVGAVFGP